MSNPLPGTIQYCIIHGAGVCVYKDGYIFLHFKEFKTCTEQMGAWKLIQCHHWEEQSQALLIFWTPSSSTTSTAICSKWSATILLTSSSLGLERDLSKVNSEFHEVPVYFPQLQSINWDVCVLGSLMLTLAKHTQEDSLRNWITFS